MSKKKQKVEKVLVVNVRIKTFPLLPNCKLSKEVIELMNCIDLTESDSERFDNS